MENPFNTYIQNALSFKAKAKSLGFTALENAIEEIVRSEWDTQSVSSKREGQPDLCELEDKHKTKISI